MSVPSKSNSWLTTFTLIIAIGLISWTTSNAPDTAMKDPPADVERMFEMQLSEMLYVEENMARKLDELQQLAQRSELKEALRKHREETMAQADRIRKIYGVMGKEGRPTPCAAYDGTMKDNDRMIAAFKESPLLDQVIVAGSRKVEHLEMSGYMNLMQTARKMERKDEIMKQIETSLNEEMATDKTLEKLAEMPAKEAGAERPASTTRPATQERTRQSTNE